MSEPRPPETVDRWSRVVTGIAIGALLAPCVAAAAVALALPVLDATPVGDDAPFEARVMTLTDPPALVGPYSRHGWHHPGPLAFWLFGIPYRLLGGAPVALHLAVATLNAACIVALVRSARVLGRSPAARAIALTGIALLVAMVSSVYAPSGLATHWSPIFTLLPFCALVLLCVELAEGDARAAVPAVLLHAFVTQSHVAYVPLATVPLVLAVALASRRRRAVGPRPGDPPATGRRAWVAAAVALALAWSPVVADTFFGSGNLWEIARYFTSSPRTEFPLSLAGAITLFAIRATAPLRALVDDDADRLEDASPWALGLALVLAAVILAGVVSGAARHRRGDRRAIGTLCLFCALQLAVGCVALLRIDEPTQVYLTWWLSALGVLSVTAAALAHAPRLEDGTRAGRLALGAGTAAAIALAVRSGLVMLDVTPAAERKAEESRAAIEPLLPALTRAYACHPRARLGIAEHDLWGVLGAVLVRLERSGAAPGIDPDWEFMFGPGFPATTGSPSFVLAAAPDPGCQTLARSEWLWALICDDTAPRTALRSLAVEGAEGDLARLTDGFAPPDGTVWDDPAAIVLAPGPRSLTAALPPVSVDGIVLTADHDESWRVEGSTDGVEYAALGTIAPTRRPGLATRRFYFDGSTLYSHVRLVASGGDGATSVAELALLEGRGTVIDVGTPEARTHLLEGWSVDESDAGATWVWAVGHESVVSLPRPDAASELLVSLRPFGALPGPQVLTIRVGTIERSFTLEDGTQTVRLALPAFPGSDDLVIHMRHAHAASPRDLGFSDDARDLAAAVHRIELRPELDPCE